jgi:hypothetical protein
MNPHRMPVDFGDTEPVIHEASVYQFARREDTRPVANAVLENQQFEDERDRWGAAADIVIAVIAVALVAAVVIACINPQWVSL